MLAQEAVKAVIFVVIIIPMSFHFDFMLVDLQRFKIELEHLLNPTKLRSVKLKFQPLTNSTHFINFHLGYFTIFPILKKHFRINFKKLVQLPINLIPLNFD